MSRRRSFTLPTSASILLSKLSMNNPELLSSSFNRNKTEHRSRLMRNLKCKTEHCDEEQFKKDQLIHKYFYFNQEIVLSIERCWVNLLLFLLFFLSEIMK